MSKSQRVTDFKYGVNLALEEEIGIDIPQDMTDAIVKALSNLYKIATAQEMRDFLDALSNSLYDHVTDEDDDDGEDEDDE